MTSLFRKLTPPSGFPPLKKLLLPPLGLALRQCPDVLQQQAALRVFPQVFSEAITDGDLDFLEGRFLGLDVWDIDYQVLLTFRNNQLVTVPYFREAEAKIGGNFDEFVRLAIREEDPDTLFFQRRLTIEGDTELGLEVKNLMDCIELTNLPWWLQQGLSLAKRVVASELSHPRPQH